MGGSDLFLATVDETIAANAIQDMAGLGIALVVAEEPKTSQNAEYKRHDSVLDSATFFRTELAERRIPAWV